ERRGPALAGPPLSGFGSGGGFVAGGGGAFHRLGAGGAAALALAACHQHVVLGALAAGGRVAGGRVSGSGLVGGGGLLGRVRLVGGIRPALRGAGLLGGLRLGRAERRHEARRVLVVRVAAGAPHALAKEPLVDGDRKSTRLNSSHVKTSYAVFRSRRRLPRCVLFPYTPLFRAEAAGFSGASGLSAGSGRRFGERGFLAGFVSAARSDATKLAASSSSGSPPGRRMRLPRSHWST